MTKITVSLLVTEEKTDDEGRKILDHDSRSPVIELREVSADLYISDADTFLVFERETYLADRKRHKITVIEMQGRVYNVTNSKKQIADLIKKARKEA